MEETPKKYSQFRAMFAITRASFRSILRSPSAVVFTLAFPLVFIVAFGFIKGGPIKLDVGLDPGSDTSGMVFRVFRNVPNINLEKPISSEEINIKLDRGRIDAIVKFDSSADGREVVEVITGKASREKGVFVESVLANIVDRYNTTSLTRIVASMDVETKKRAMMNTDIIELKEGKREGTEYKSIDFILPGQLGFSILSAGVFGTAFVFFSLRQTMVLKRFFATPIKRMYIILGEAISRLLFQLLGSAFIIILGKYVFGFTLVHGISTFALMLFIASIGLIIFMGFGFVVSGIAKNESVIPIFANIVTLPQMLLCGTFFPVDAFPPWLQNVSKALPLTYLNDALRKVAFEGAGIVDISPQLLVLFIWGVIIYTAAVKFFRWE